MNSPLVVITGPTASGKSAFAMEVAERFGGELICADSRTIYKGMDIGTAKPTRVERQKVKHHLLDIVTPDQTFTAHQFKVLALKAIVDITNRGKLPIMVGGTGLYIDTVIFDYQFGPPATPCERALLQGKSIDQLLQICLENGYRLPINIKNKRHLVRAIEMGGVWQRRQQLRPHTLVVGITTEKDILRSRIAERAAAMVDEGVLKEVTRLSTQYGWHVEAMSGNIYRIMRPVIESRVSVDEALENCIRSDIQLAKRQMTWFRRNPYIVWGSTSQLMSAIEHFVHQNRLSESMPHPL